MTECLFECEQCERDAYTWAQMKASDSDAVALTAGVLPECLRGEDGCICPEGPADEERKATVVVNLRNDLCDIYIGRPSSWGNPFLIGRDGTRMEVIAKYRAWIRTQPTLLYALHELRGKRLGCYCAPQACHGDVLVELIGGDDD